MPDRPADLAQQDVIAGLPDDLAKLLRDPSILVPQDAAVFKLIAEWMDAPSDTASALSVDEWREAWVYSTRRWREAEAERDALASVVETQREALERVVREFDMWSEDANDGTYAYYRSDGLMTACVNARAAIAGSVGDTTT